MKQKDTQIYLKPIIMQYIQDGMSASPGRVYELIPDEIKDEIFVRSERSKRTPSVCNAIYSLMKEGKIFEVKGRYYVNKNGGVSS